MLGMAGWERWTCGRPGPGVLFTRGAGKTSVFTVVTQAVNTRVGGGVEEFL